MDINKEREAFESVFTEAKGWDLTFIMGCYQNIETLRAFAGWQAAKAQAVPEGFILIKDDTKTVVAIERMVEQQVEASGMDSRRLERLDGWKIIEAAVKAQEPAK